MYAKYPQSNQSSFLSTGPDIQFLCNFEAGAARIQADKGPGERQLGWTYPTHFGSRLYSATTLLPRDCNLDGASRDSSCSVGLAIFPQAAPGLYRCVVSGDMQKSVPFEATGVTDVDI